MTRVSVQVWSDIICPWCGLGSHRLDTALSQFAHRDDVAVVHRAFRLDPAADTKPVRVADMLARKMGIAPAEVPAITGQVEQLAAADGLVPYIVGDNWVANTTWAHELIALAADQGLGDRAWHQLVRAYFGEVRSVFDIESLSLIGAEIGLDPDAVAPALAEHRYLPQVEADERVAHSLGVRGVPFYRIGALDLSGARPVADLLLALTTAWDTAEPDAISDSADALVCGPDGCAVPSHQHT